MKLIQKQCRFTAYHEAGHAVFSYIYGVPFRRIALLRENGIAGHIVFEDFAEVIELLAIVRKRIFLNNGRFSAFLSIQPTVQEDKTAHRDLAGRMVA